MSMNIQILVGRIAQDVKLEIANDNTTFLSFIVVTDDGHFENNTNRWIPKTQRHRVVVYKERLIMWLAGLLSKGNLVFVQGHLENDTYEQDGVIYHAATTIAETVRLLESRP